MKKIGGANIEEKCSTTKEPFNECHPELVSGSAFY